MAFKASVEIATTASQILTLIEIMELGCVWMASSACLFRTRFSTATGETMLHRIRTLRFTSAGQKISASQEASVSLAAMMVGPSSNITVAGLVTSGLFNASTNPNGAFTNAAVQGSEPTTGYNVSGVNDIPDTTRSVTGVAAYAGGGQASATSLTATLNTVSTASVANASVKLVPCVPGRQQTIANLSANSIQVFGANPDTINGTATATGVAQAVGKIATYFCTGFGNWSRLLSN